MVDVPQRLYEEHDEIHRTYGDQDARHSWSAQVALVQSSSGGLASTQPAIMGQQTDPDDNISYVSPPLVNDVPIHFPGGGGVSITHPVTMGDEGTLIHHDRNIDNWWQSGGQVQPLDLRYSSHSDAVLIPGLRSKPRQLSNVSATTFQIRSDDGTVTIDVDPVGKRIRIFVPVAHKIYLGADPDQVGTSLFFPVLTTGGACPRVLGYTGT